MAIVRPDLSLLMLQADFEIDCSLEKAEEAEKKGRGPIRGIASSEREDSDGEIVIQKGINWDWFINHGFITYEHPLTVTNIIGEPKDIRLVEHDGVPATELFGELYLNDPLGKLIWQKALAMKKSGSKRKLGMSIEGRAKRDPDNPRKIVEATVESVAISPRPINKDSWWEPLAASMLFRSGFIGYPSQAVPHVGGLGVLVPQDLEGHTRSKEMSLEFMGVGGDKGSPKKPKEDGKGKVSPPSDESVIMALLRAFPRMSYLEAKQVFDTLKERFTPKDYISGK